LRHRRRQRRWRLHGQVGDGEVSGIGPLGKLRRLHLIAIGCPTSGNLVAVARLAAVVQLLLQDPLQEGRGVVRNRSAWVLFLLFVAEEAITALLI
jgi:hypothetical protein